MGSKRIWLTLAVITLLGLVSVVGDSTQAQTVNPRDALEHGNQQYARAHYQLAIEEYRRVPSNSGHTYAKALYNTGICFYELWKTEEAVAYYRKAIEATNGHYPAAFHALGVALKDLGRLPEAKKAFELSILTSDGNYAPAHYLLGALAIEQADHESAVRSFKKAIAGFKYPFPAAHNNLGVALARLHRLNEAKVEFETALSQAGGDFFEASQNLKLCNSLLTQPTKATALLVVEEPRKLIR